MKKILLLLLPVLILLGNNAVAQEKKGWPSNERYSFISECLKSAKASLSEDSARFYCYCMQEKLELKYPDIEEAGKKIPTELSSPEMKREMQNCRTGIGQWSPADRSEFLKNCIDAAKGSFGEAKAKSYCECMLFKTERKHPDPDDAAQITAETLQTPDWQKMIKDCAAF